MIELFVKRPATTVMFVLFFVLLGFVSYFNINVEQSPKIEFPLVVVNVVYPGASPLEIETQALKKIEDSVVEISAIKKIESRAFESAGYVLIEFLLSEDVNVKTAEVKDKVEGILNDLPTAMDRPIIQRVDPFAQSVVNLVLTSDKHSAIDLYEYADKKLKSQFSKIPGVGNIDIFGGNERQIRVELSPELMKRKYISISDVIDTMKSNNLTVPGGNIDQRESAVAVRFVGEFDSIESIQKMPITTKDGSRFALEEIARVYDGGADVEKMAKFSGKDVVSLSIKKISDGNEVKVSEGIRRSLADIEKILPEGMKLSIAVDKSSVIVRETNDTMLSILIGIALTVLVLFLFTGNLAITGIATIVIPSSIISAFFLMENSQFTINFITLLAIATSLGTLIANAIVIIESVLGHLEKGVDSVNAAIQGTKDVVVPVIAACGTNLVVFTPIAFMGGIVGQFMLQFGLTVVYATLFSLMASFSLTPMLCALFLKPVQKDKKKNKIVEVTDKLVAFLLKEYKIIFDQMFRFPKISTGLAVALIFGGFSVAPYLGNEFIPVSDEDRLEVAITLPQGTKISKTAEVVAEIEAELAKYPEIESTLATLGENGEENASVVANLFPKNTRSRSDNDLIQLMTPTFAMIPDAEIELKRGDGGGGITSDVQINVEGLDYAKMVELSNRVMEYMKETGYFRSVVSSYKTPKSEVRFLPNPIKLDKYGVSNAQIGQVLRASIYGDDSNIYREAGEEYDILIEVDQAYKVSLAALSDISLLSNVGLVPLVELGSLQVTRATPSIQRRDRHRVIQLNSYLAKSTAGLVQAELEKEFETWNLPEGYDLKFVGNSESQEESGREIGKAFGLAILLTYMLLAALMNSFVHPFTISSSIVSAFSGVFLMLFFIESSINIASMLGFVMLVGLAVNNAILILEETELQLAKGDKTIVEALWLGMQTRFRAVLMTSIAIVSGSLPQMWSSDLAKASMGAVIVGGMLASIVFTFILVPQTYWFFERFRRWIGGLFKSKESSNLGKAVG